jgi:hypothetical protein
MPRAPKRRIKAAKISLISLVPAGANQVRSLFKSQDAVELSALAKIDAEGYLTTLVYMPDATDTHGDTADVVAIKQWAHDFIPNMDGNGIDVLHDCEPVGNERAHICETFIVQKGDPRFEGLTTEAGDLIDPTGSWGVVIKIDDPDLRSRYATGEWVGVSMFGSAIVEPVTAKSTTPTKETEMDPKEMAEMLKAFGADLSATIVEGLSKALAPTPVEEPVEDEVVKAPAIEFEGDPMNVEDLAKHADKVFLASCDLNTVDGLAKWREHLAAKAPVEEPVEDEVVKEPVDDAEITKLEREIAKLKKASANSAEPRTAPEGAKTLAEKLAKSTERAVRLRKEGIIR